MLSWDDFRFVKAIAYAGSLRKAAQSLGVNASTVFRRLVQIEHQLGCRLFDHSRYGYALTSCGEDMARLAKRLDDDIIAFERRMTGRDLRPSGELRVTTSDMVLLHLLTDVLVGFRRAYPDIAVDVVVSNTLLNLSKRDADVAVRATYRAPGSLSGRCIGRIAWAVFGPSSLVGKPFDLVTDPARHTWVAFADYSALARTSKWLRDHAVDGRRIIYKVNTLLGLAEAVAGEVGLALLPCYIGNTVPGLVRLCEPLPDLEGELWLLAHPDLMSTARVSAFLDFCAAEMGERRGVLEGAAVGEWTSAADLPK